MLLCAVISTVVLIVGLNNGYVLIAIGVILIVALFIMAYNRIKDSLIVSFLIVLGIVICACFKIGNINEYNH